jgi:hypothetical protein
MTAEKGRAEMERFVARNSRTRLVLILLGSLLFVAIGLWMVGAFGEPPQGSGRAAGTNWVGWIAIPFFGAVALAIIGRLRDAGEQLVVDESGIVWRAWSDDVVPWSEIEKIVERHVARQVMFAVHLRDPSRCPPTRWTGRIAARQRGFGMGDMSISVSGTDRSNDELRNALTRFFPGMSG